MSKKKLFIWVCDYSENSGEGQLARLFVQNLKNNNQLKIIFNQKKKDKSKIYFCNFRYILLLEKILSKSKSMLFELSTIMELFNIHFSPSKNFIRAYNWWLELYEIL